MPVDPLVGLVQHFGFCLDRGMSLTAMVMPPRVA